MIYLTSPPLTGDDLDRHAQRELDEYVEERGTACADLECVHPHCAEVRRLRQAAEDPRRSFATMTDHEFAAYVQATVLAAGGLAPQLYVLEGVEGLRGPRYDHLVREHDARAKRAADEKAERLERAGELARSGLLVICADRGAGKTTAIIDWLACGEAIRSQPGWSRIVLCQSPQSAELVNTLIRERLRLGPGNYPRFALTVAQWRLSAAGTDMLIEVAIDDAETVLQDAACRRHLALVTMTATPKVNVCTRCKGGGWEPDKPWKGEHRKWMRCGTCQNAAGLPEPLAPPKPEDWPDHPTPVPEK